MKGWIFDETGIGYFNGLADHASKTAIQLREKYLPLEWWHGGAGLTERSERGSLSAVGAPWLVSLRIDVLFLEGLHTSRTNHDLNWSVFRMPCSL